MEGKPFQDLMRCDKCPLNGAKVGSKGPKDAKLVIIGESPGIQEVRKGIPFIGPSGEVLDAILRYPIKDAYVLNALQCSPTKLHKKNPALMQEATRICNGRLIGLIQRHPRQLILTLGNNALWSVTGNYGYKITQARGFLIPSSLSELGILPAVHPAALLRGTGSFRQFAEDMIYASELIHLGRDAIKVPPNVEYTEVTSKKQLAWIKRKLKKETELTCDLETSGFNPREDYILAAGICGPDHHVYDIKPEHIMDLKTLFENRRIKWNYHNGKFDVQFLRAVGIDARVGDDTMLMSYALDEKPGVHDLEQVSSDILGAPDYKDMLKPYLPNKKTSYSVIPSEVLNEYLAIDVVNTSALRPILKRRVEADPATSKLYHKMLLPASEMLSRMEHNGFYVDMDWVDKLDVEYKERIAECEHEIEHAAGVLFNPNSPQQVSNILFHHLKLPNKAKGSTAVDVLEKLPQHPVVKLIMQHRIIKKAHGTYIKPMYRHIDEFGRIHATFLIHGTKTGRLASRNPNLQNIPRDPRLRGMFTAAPGCVLLEVDLSQAELRSLACLSGDPRLVSVYVNGFDLHLEVEQYLFGTSGNKENRVKSKNVNFGIIYGITGPGLAEQTGKSARECTQWIDSWYHRFPEAAEFIKKCRDTVPRGQVITTLFGRKKRVGLVSAANIWGLQNEAANFPHQSIASDITLYTAIKVEPQLREWGVKIVDLVHDSIITEIPSTDQDLQRMVGSYISEEMEYTPIEWGLVKVPFIADIEVGQRWGHLKETANG